MSDAVVDPRDELAELYGSWFTVGPLLRREVADRAVRLGYSERCITRAFKEHGALTVIGNRGRGSAAVWSSGDKHSALGAGSIEPGRMAQPADVLSVTAPGTCGPTVYSPPLTHSPTSRPPNARLIRPHPTYLGTLPTDRFGFDAVWFSSRVWACEMPDPHEKLFEPITEVLDRFGYRHDLRLSQGMPLTPAAGRRFYWWYGYVIRCRPPRHLAHLLPRLHIRYGPSDPSKPLLQVRVYPSIHTRLDLDFVGRLLLTLADAIVTQLRWRDILQIDLAQLFEVSLLELAWDWPLYYGRLDEVVPRVHVPYARKTSIEDVPYDGRYRWGSLKSGSSVFTGYTKVEDDLVFRRWERRIRHKDLREVGIRFCDDLRKPEVTQLYTARFPLPYQRWLGEAIRRFNVLQQTPPTTTGAMTSSTSAVHTPTATASGCTKSAATTSPDPRDPTLVRATYSAEHQVVERFWERELTPVIGASAAQALASGVPVLTQTDRLAAIIPSATLQAIFENVDPTPVYLRAGDRAARRCVGQLRRQVPQHVHDLRIALRGVQTASERAALVACLDAAVQMQRALDRWIVDERNDSVNKRLRGRQKQKTNVGSVIQQVTDLRQLVERLRGAGGAQPDNNAPETSSAASGVPATRYRSHCYVCGCSPPHSVSSRCRSSPSRAEPHREILQHGGTCAARSVRLSCARLAGMLDPGALVEVS